MIAHLISFLRHRLSMDRAIAASTATQLIRFVTGPVTMFLIIRFLTPEEQGFFYSFAGVVGIQVFLEAGFAQSITQFSSKEFASLRFNRQGLLTGSPAALSRLRSIFQKSRRYYMAMAAVLSVVLATGGYFFFSSKPSYGVPWMIPWFVVSLCAGLGFQMTPVWALLEGCNLVPEIATYRFWVTLIGFTVTAVGLFLGLGIYVTALATVVTLIFPICYLALRWRKLILQILRPPGAEQVSWKKEIWGFQWRIALTWGFKYLLFPFTPALAFAISGPVIAGKIGLCYQLALIGVGLGSTWTVTKIPRWGTLIAQGEQKTFRSEWKAAAKLHVGVVILTQSGALIAITAINLAEFSFADRFLSPLAFSGFAIGVFFHSFWLIFSHYFRSGRQEPYTLITAIAAASYITISFLLISFGENSIPYAFAFANLIGAVTAHSIWKKYEANSHAI